MRQVLSRLVLLVLTCGLLLVGGPAIALAQVPLPDTDWTVRSTFFGEDGEDIPLRIGRHDSPIRDGFGVRHIQDGHDEVPDEHDIAAVLMNSGSLCKDNANDGKSRCALQIGDRAIFVVFTDRVDDATPDGRPLGVITAYYSPRGCPC